jgi:hypothetical protein
MSKEKDPEAYYPSAALDPPGDLREEEDFDDSTYHLSLDDSSFHSSDAEILFGASSLGGSTLGYSTGVTTTCETSTTASQLSNLKKQFKQRPRSANERRYEPRIAESYDSSSGWNDESDSSNSGWGDEGEGTTYTEDDVDVVRKRPDSRSRKPYHEDRVSKSREESSLSDSHHEDRVSKSREESSLSDSHHEDRVSKSREESSLADSPDIEEAIKSQQTKLQFVNYGSGLDNASTNKDMSTVHPGIGRDDAMQAFYGEKVEPQDDQLEFVNYGSGLADASTDKDLSTVQPGIGRDEARQAFFKKCAIPHIIPIEEDDHLDDISSIGGKKCEIPHIIPIEEDDHLDDISSIGGRSLRHTAERPPEITAPFRNLDPVDEEAGSGRMVVLQSIDTATTEDQPDHSLKSLFKGNELEAFLIGLISVSVLVLFLMIILMLQGKY